MFFEHSSFNKTIITRSFVLPDNTNLTTYSGTFESHSYYFFLLLEYLHPFNIDKNL